MFKLSKSDPKTRVQVQVVYLEGNSRNHWYKIGKYNGNQRSYGRWYMIHITFLNNELDRAKEP